MKRLFSKLSAILLVFAIILSVANFSAEVHAATATSAAGIVNIGYGSLNVRSSASSSSAIVAKLAKGSYVTLISKTGNWWKVEYAGGSYGYVSADFITKVSGTTASVGLSSGYLNVRSGAGASYPVTAQLPSGRTVITLSSGSGWSRILYNGTNVGYVSSQYLRAVMAWPVPASSRINQYFVSGSHLGIDIGSSVPGVTGDTVVAAYGGTVVYSGALNGYGYVVYINSYYNGQYIQTRYAHLKTTPSVSVGSVVGIGQTIGYMGNSGESTGAHTHFEVRIRSSSGNCIANSESTPVNPLNYVRY
ncbi:MAG: SH3 domain-containing protein [Bacillota bacterium]|nr:SH3 domain-containing protein [Bacillota bacterium]